MQRKLIILIICLLSCWMSVFAQQKGTVSGTVKDADSGEALIGVSIYVEKLKMGTTTNEKGYYELSLPVDEQQITVSYVGYISENKRVTVTRKPQKLNFSLQPETEMLSEVVISSEQANRNVSKMAMSVQTLDMRTIKKIPALMGEVDVIKSIQLLPGVQAASEGSSGFSVRGGGTDQNLILLDNAPIYNASHFLGFFSVFNNDVVKDATLYKGDIPANYGGRLSSVLDVQVKDDMPKKFSMQGGVGLVTSRLMLESPLFDSKTSVLASARTTYAGLVIPFLGEDLKGSDIYFNDFNVKVTQTLNEKNRLFVSAYHGHDQFSMKDMVGLGYGNSSATLRWNHIFSNRLTSNLSATYSHFNYAIDIWFDPYDFTIKAGTNSGNLSYDFAMMWNEKHTSKFGIVSGFQAYKQGQLFDRGGALSQYLQVDSTANVVRKGLEHALYFTHDYVPSPRLSFRFGVRLSCFQNMGEEEFFVFDAHHNVTDTLHYAAGEIFHTEIHPEPRLAAMFRIDETSSVKASYSRTVQYAQVASAATGGLPFDVWFPISPNIKPQKCDQFALGYFRNFKNDAIETSVEAYYKNYQNVIDFKDNAMTYGNLLIDGELRCGKGRSYGVEFLVRKNVGKFTGWISYTYSRTFRTIEDINFGKEYRSPYDRPHNIVLVANYDFTPRISVAANWIYNTGQPVTYPYGQCTVGGVTYAIYNGSRNESRYPAYHRMDISATFKLSKPRWKKWESELNVSVYNAYAHHNTWAITFGQNPDGGIATKKMYLFSTVPSISYNFKF
ncbi:MAG: TonB-dependent receptor [Bacteroidales bacterium]|nr:TonB-dependent receptor [Bacteroidales bacterium]